LAEHTKLHLWLNTGIALAAFAAAGTSGFVSWKSYSLNVESLGFSSIFTYDCPFGYGVGGREKVEHTFLSLCWRVTVANQSGSRISVVGYTISRSATEKGGLVNDVLDLKGHSIPMPFTLDAGDARRVIVSAGVPITDALGKLISDAIEEDPSHPE
jgi:hypothetical protein